MKPFEAEWGKRIFLVNEPHCLDRLFTWHSTFCKDCVNISSATKMLTKKTARIIDNLVTAGSWLNVLPFIWSRQTSSLSIGGRKQRLVFTGLIVYMYWEACYQGYRLFWDGQMKPMDTPQYIKLVELFATRLTALVTVTVTWLHSDDMIFFANQLLRLKDRFSRKLQLLV